MAINAGSRDPQSLSMARRVSSCVVNGPGVKSSGDCAMATSLLGGAGAGTPAGEPPQSPSGEQHHEGDANAGRRQEGRAQAQPDDRSQEIEQIVEVEAERSRIGLTARSIQSLQLLRPVAGKEKRRTAPQAERHGGPAPWRFAQAQPERDKECRIHNIVDQLVVAMAAWG